MENDIFALTVERVKDPAELFALESAYLAEIGEAPMDEAKSKRLAQAIAAGRITFFAAKHQGHPVGMCSVASCWSTFACGETGVFEDFYVEPAFRRRGIARRLVQAAQSWCREKGYASLTVTCAPCDAEMYAALGFDIRLGTTRAAIIS